MTGPPGQPLRAGASVIDIMGALFGVAAAQAALREREITGKGQRVSSALFESAAFLMSTHMAGMVATGLEARPMPARRGAWAVYEIFQTGGGGQLFIGVTSDQQWTRFVEEFGLQELAADPRLATNVTRGWQNEPGSSRLYRRCWRPCRRTRWRGAANGATCHGRRSPNRATCSPTPTFWLPADWSTCSFPALAATVKSPVCRPCRSSLASIAGVLGYGASRRAWASIMPRC